MRCDRWHSDTCGRCARGASRGTETTNLGSLVFAAEQDGSFKGQDIPGRLRNVKGKDTTANQWFRTLVGEKGPLIIEYGLLTTVPKSPALIEAVLLQAHLNEHGCLPYRNRAF